MLRPRKIEKLAQNIFALYSDDERNPYEVTQRKRPKRDVLLEIEEHIKNMLDRLYPIVDQVTIISNSIPGYSITADTYRLYLKEQLPKEYNLYRINQYLIRKSSAIKEASLTCKSAKEQYEALGLSKVVLHGVNISLTDFKGFLKKYYIEDFEKYTKKRVILAKPLDGDNKIIETSEGAHVVEKAEQIPASTFETTLEEPKKELLHVNSSQEEGKINLIRGITVDNIPSKYAVETDMVEFPAEVTLLADTSKEKFYEKFIYFLDLELLSAANFDPVNLEDNQLIICGTAYSSQYSTGYLIYRYFRGKIYFIKHFVPQNGGPSYRRQMRMWSEENYSEDFYNFCLDEWVDYKKN